MSSAAAWLGRTILLVLAAMSTLAIIGSIAAIPSTPDGARSVQGQEAPRSVTYEIPPPEAPGRSAMADAEEAVDEAATTEHRRLIETRVYGPVFGNDQLRWLEPLTYAMLALAGLLALIAAMLWRIAERLDARTLR